MKRVVAGISTVALVIVFGLYIGCKKTTVAAVRGPNEVWVQNMSYNPATLTVAVNTTVKWTNMDGYAHTVSSDSLLFDSGNVNASASFSYQFTKAGTYPYHCNIHANMHAMIIVQ